MSEDAKGVIKSRMSNNNGQQNTTQKTKYWETQIPFNAKTGSARSMPKTGSSRTMIYT